MARTAHIHDRNGPLALAGLVVAALTAILLISVHTLVATMREQKQDLAFLLASLRLGTL